MKRMFNSARESAHVGMAVSLVTTAMPPPCNAD
jgi:hypothetical protein